MQILLLSSLCSHDKYAEICSKRKVARLDTNQKFLHSVLEGMSLQSEAVIDCISHLPISYSTYPDKIIHSTRDTEDNIRFQYIASINFPILRTLVNELEFKIQLKKYLKNHSGEIVVLCDALCMEAASTIKILRRHKIQSVAIVTDVPTIVNKMDKGSGIKKWLSALYAWRSNRLIDKFDKLVLLSEKMNDICNKKLQKKYIVMECIASAHLFDNVESKTAKRKLPVVLYAGKLYKDCGVVELAKAAKLLRGICEVWMYGQQEDCNDELDRAIKETDNLVIRGVVPLSDILEIEKSVDVLINPRPENTIFSAYSFPSKTAEYMLSGVPTLTYKLSSIPSSYDNYLNYISGNGATSIACAVKELLSIDIEKRTSKALRARQFIIENKSECVQAKRILKLIEDN